MPQYHELMYVSSHGISRLFRSSVTIGGVTVGISTTGTRYGDVSTSVRGCGSWLTCGGGGGGGGGGGCDGGGGEDGARGGGGRWRQLFLNLSSRFIAPTI